MRPLAENTTDPLNAAHPNHAAKGFPQYEDADVHASSDEYAARFGDKVGQWMLAKQEQALISLLDQECTTVLDVGGGHGQIALPLAHHQRAVTVLGSAPVCAERLSSEIEQGLISFKTGNLLELPYDDRSFDLTTSFRLISHCVAWRQLIAELCRVSRHAVIIDYPVWLSVNILTPVLFSVKRAIEGNTRTYTMFSNREIAAEFKKHGFKLEANEKLFAWPMALHRAMKSVSFSERLEAPARWLFITRLFGSPVVAKFVREE
jgi:SAM-dependent methyltransferase